MPLSVIGAGFGRTGTLSLKLALEQLGFGPCYHMVEVFKNPEAPAYWEAVADGGPVDWEEVFEGYRSTVDWPSATFYRELAEAYPDAKVILTVRDPDAWFRSTQETIFGPLIPKDETNPHSRMVMKVIDDLFGRDMHNRERLISVFNAHNARVREVIAPERLLVYEVAEGWGPLCAFLGAPVPETPMPRVNSTEEFRQMVAGMRAQAQAAAAPA